MSGLSVGILSVAGWDLIVMVCLRSAVAVGGGWQRWRRLGRRAVSRQNEWSNQLEISRQIGESESSSEAMMLQLSIQNRHTIRVLVIVDDFMLDFAPSRDICIN